MVFGLSSLSSATLRWARTAGSNRHGRNVHSARADERICRDTEDAVCGHGRPARNRRVISGECPYGAVAPLNIETETLKHCFTELVPNAA